MSEFEAKSLCILGRQPKLGLAELESLYGAEHLKPLGQAALLDIAADSINFKRLGGTIKTARALAQIPYSDWQHLTKYLRDNIPKHLAHLPEGKFTLGLSVYGLRVSPGQINHSLLEIKKVIRQSGRPARVVPNKSPVLSSAQILHNKLTHKGAWELIFVADGRKTTLAQTLYVQDIEAYAARDQARPARDPRLGMLPPKLAQQIINLAVPAKIKDQGEKVRILDPFCGTGVILQESLLMGYSVFGTDIDRRMAQYAKTNMQWLLRQYPEISGQVSIEVADATNYQWPRFTATASETYLGPPLARMPDDFTLKRIVSETNAVIEKFLKNLSPQLSTGHRICLAVPAWRKAGGQFIHLPVIAKLTDMGYNIVKFKHAGSEDLVYYREGQIVARKLLVMEKK
ncbi:MAG TPA: hypothetical protein VIK37_01615 [Candidatus Saccharimonadales bacterium]